MKSAYKQFASHKEIKNEFGTMKWNHKKKYFFFINNTRQLIKQKSCLKNKNITGKIHINFPRVNMSKEICFSS